MANQQILELVRQQPVDEWNLFRFEHPEEVIDLSGADLSETNLGRINLSNANLSRADLCGANLWEASITSTQLSKGQPPADCL